MSMRRHWAWAGVLVAVSALVVTAGCSKSSEPAHCSSNDECGEGLVCGTTDCTGIATCIRAGCECREDGFRNPCGPDTGSSCSCTSATCADPWDSCGKQLCPGVCTSGESCQFCLEGDDCELVSPCLSSWCLVDSAGQAACRPLECLTPPLEPPLCGSADAPCGACPEPNCADKQCGEDLLTGQSCGTCGAHRYCIDNQCRQDSAYSLCPGGLVALDDEIAIEPMSGTLPEALGGTIADGTYDLVAQHEYRETISEKYRRSALRFSVGATRVEHIYDAEVGSQADSDSPHRLMTVGVAGTTLQFQIECPSPSTLIFPNYTRGFTAQGDELWLFQDHFVEIYQRRP